MVYFQSFTLQELAQLLLPMAEERFRHFPDAEKRAEKRALYQAKQLFHWVYQRYVWDWDQMTDLSKQLREWLRANVTIYIPEEKHSHQSLDGTYKFLWNLHDQKTIESVIIPQALGEGARESFAGTEAEEKDLTRDHWTRLTVCISSQVGCAMACKFCLTGIQGLDRHLQTHEIIGQVMALRKIAPLTNVVFMGMGEPLHNLDNTIKACKILLDPDGLAFSKRKVTVSTSGIVPAIRELGKNVDVSLAISLNGSTDEQREKIMPVNKRWKLADLLGACRDYPLGPHRKITFEYVLIEGLNDTVQDAERVAQLLHGIPCMVNLIPFNEHPGVDFKRPSDDVVRAFRSTLIRRGYVATVRASRGRDILAACGQLRSVFGTARGTHKHRDFAPELPQTSETVGA